MNSIYCELKCNLFLVLQKKSGRSVAEAAFFWLLLTYLVISRTTLTYLSKLKRKCSQNCDQNENEKIEPKVKRQRKRKCHRKTKTKMILKTKKTLLGGTHEGIWTFIDVKKTVSELTIALEKTWDNLPQVQSNMSQVVHIVSQKYAKGDGRHSEHLSLLKKYL